MSVCVCYMLYVCIDVYGNVVVSRVSVLPHGSDLGAAIRSKAALIHLQDWSDKSFIKPSICHLCHWVDRLGQRAATLETPVKAFTSNHQCFFY